MVFYEVYVLRPFVEYETFSNSYQLAHVLFHNVAFICVYILRISFVLHFFDSLSYTCRFAHPHMKA